MPPTTPAPSTRTATPPSKRWRNYYRVYRVLNLGRVGHLFPGVHAGPDVFPSKEIADEHARLFVAAINPPPHLNPRRWLMDHAGAFPEGDAAH
jgi:hypothetical protein